MESCGCLDVYCTLHFMHRGHQTLPRSQNSRFEFCTVCNLLRVCTSKCFSLTCNVCSRLGMVAVSPAWVRKNSVVLAITTGSRFVIMWHNEATLFMSTADSQVNVCHHRQHQSSLGAEDVAFPNTNDAWEHTWSIMKSLRTWLSRLTGSKVPYLYIYTYVMFNSV